MNHHGRVPGMPARRTALIGRERELQAARTVLADPETRLLTLTGVGGCGKTRLAFQLVTDFAPDYPQRIWAVELAPVVDPELIPLVVAKMLDLQESSSRSSMSAIAACFGARPALLLLDNCEHLIEACASFVDRLLDACPQLRVIATSREPLSIAGERQYRVPPLDTPDPEALNTVAVIAAAPAVELFVARAQDVERSFVLTPANAATIAQICARLEGIPLAIELAAARVPVLSVEQIVERLDDSFRLLTRGSRVAPTRHQTLRAALDWSDALLTEDERSVFRRLWVFAGEFQLEAVEALCADVDTPPDPESTLVVDAMTGLVGKSLVMVSSDGQAAWYHLLEPVRQYALEQSADDEVEDARTRHAAFYLDLAERAADGLRRPAQEIWLGRLEREQGNLRAALDWAQQESSSFELRLAVALVPFWTMRGHLTEGLGRARGALVRDTTTDNLPLRARALAGAGRLSSYLDHSPTSRYAEAEEFTAESLRLARELGDEQAIATALGDLGWTHQLQGDFARSLACQEQALEILRVLNDEHGEAHALLHLGIGIYMHRDRVQGTRMVVESLDRFRALGDLRWATMAQVVLGPMARDRREFGRAIELIVEGIATHLRVGDRWFVAFELLVLGGVLIDAGHPRQGVKIIGAAQALSDRMGSPSPVAGVPFADVTAQVDRLRREDWFEPVWVAGYALDPPEAVLLARALLDEPASRDPSAEPYPEGAHLARAPLTRRELEVARLLAEGYTDRQIADTLFIAVSTASRHVHHILEKLDLQSRVQVAGRLAAQGSPGPEGVSPQQTALLAAVRSGGETISYACHEEEP